MVVAVDPVIPGGRLLFPLGLSFFAGCLPAPPLVPELVPQTVFRGPLVLLDSEVPIFPLAADLTLGVRDRHL